MPEPPADVARELTLLETELKRLETEYTMYFAGRLPRPPWETRRRVEAMVKHLDRAHLSNYGDRFRFGTLQARVAAFIDLWDRALRAREEGRPGPFAPPRPPAPAATAAADRVVHVATFQDPVHEIDKLRDLYDTLADARRDSGQESIPFHRFAELVRTQVTNMRHAGCPEVAFRVAIREGKVAFTARGLKGSKGRSGKGEVEK